MTNSGPAGESAGPFRLTSVALGLCSVHHNGMSASHSPLIDDFAREHPISSEGTPWQFLTDGVMGGVSDGAMKRECIAGRTALRMHGNVSLENNGGFLQIALDLSPDGAAVDASRWQGIAIDVRGPPETYGIHLRTADLARPWQSYRQSFSTTPDWQTMKFGFTEFQPHRTDVPFNPARLRRLGLVAIGKAFDADLAVSRVSFF